MVNGLNKNIRIDNPTKGGGPREQGMVRTQLEIVEVGKSLTISSQMQSIFFTVCGMFQSEITNIIGIYNQSKYGARMRHIPANGLR